jgi:hypothetical protein
MAWKIFGGGQQPEQPGEAGQSDPCAGGHDIGTYTNEVNRVIHYCKRTTCSHTTENLTPEQLAAAARQKR